MSRSTAYPRFLDDVDDDEGDVLADVVDRRQDGQRVARERQLHDLQQLDHLAQRDRAGPGEKKPKLVGPSNLRISWCKLATNIVMSCLNY